MKQEQVTQTVYITDDGKKFFSKEEAEKHEQTLQNTTLWRVYHEPDLTEGRGWQRTTYLLVEYGNTYQLLLDELVVDFCYRHFGRPVAFVMGCNHCPTEAWIVRKVDLWELDKPVFARCGDYVNKELVVLKLVLGDGDRGFVLNNEEDE